MAKLSRQTKETIKTIVVLIIVGLLITAYTIYPLNNSDTLFARTNLTDYNIDSLPPNDIGLYTNAAWKVDTFRVEPDALTSIACISVKDSLTDSTKGTVIILPSSDSSRNSQLALIEELIKNSFICITYDLRATGLSSGKYHGFGSLEATDLQEIISSLAIHGQMTPPLYIVGTELGADAAIFSTADEPRIKKIVAIEPFLTTDNVIESAKEKHNSIWFPLYNSVMFWWYGMNSGYAPEYTELADITPVSSPTLLITSSTNEALNKIVAISDKSMLTLKNNNSELISTIVSYIKK